MHLPTNLAAPAVTFTGATTPPEKLASAVAHLTALAAANPAHAEALTQKTLTQLARLAPKNPLRR